MGRFPFAPNLQKTKAEHEQVESKRRNLSSRTPLPCLISDNPFFSHLRFISPLKCSFQGQNKPWHSAVSLPHKIWRAQPSTRFRKSYSNPCSFFPTLSFDLDQNLIPWGSREAWGFGNRWSDQKVGLAQDINETSLFANAERGVCYEDRLSLNKSNDLVRRTKTRTGIKAIYGNAKIEA